MSQGNAVGNLETILRTTTGGECFDRAKTAVSPLLRALDHAITPGLIRRSGRIPALPYPPIKPLHTERQCARKLVSSRQHPDTPIAKHHEHLLKVGRHAQLRIDVAICL